MKAYIRSVVGNDYNSGGRVNMDVEVENEEFWRNLFFDKSNVEIDIKLSQSNHKENDSKKLKDVKG